MEETKEDRVEYKIYRIVCNETGEVYYGKTIQTLELRLCKHKDLSCTSKQIIERGNYYMEQIDSTFDEKESIILERYYIETFECINIRIPGRTAKEYYEEYMKEYYKAHKEERKEKYTCECGSTVRIDTKRRHERSQKHIDYINSKK